MARKLLTMLLATAVVGFVQPAAAQGPAQSPAQSSPARSTDVDPVTVTAARRTGEWKPTPNPVPVELRVRGAEACWLITQDPFLRAMVATGAEPRIFEDTRYPRNPDWNAPPVTPPGSAYPDVLTAADYLKGQKENVLGLPAAAAASASADSGGADATPAAGDDGSTDEALAKCFSGTRPGGAFSPARAPVFASGPGDGPRRADPYAEMKARDTKLPLAFALFDHGRYEEALGEFKAVYRKFGDMDGGDEAALTVGKIYLFGLREKSDPVQGVAWLKKAADARFDTVHHMPKFDPLEPERNTALGEAAMILADVYGGGRGPVAKDPAQARKYLERAYFVGHIPAGMTLGDIYYFGIDTPKDAAKAFDNYMKAARFAYAPAAVAVAQMYASGEAKGGRDAAKALAWYGQAARMEHPQGLYAIAVAYDRGEGAPANADKALAFYKLAAAKGSPEAQTAVGTYFYTGEGGLPHDLVLARKWFELAATGGDADGMFNLAAMQAKGEGGPVDRVKAWGWLKIAEKLGRANATAAVQALEGQFTQEDRAGVDDLKRAG